MPRLPSRQAFLRVLSRAWVVPVAAAIAAGYPTLVEPVWLDATHVRVSLASRPPRWPGLRIGFFTDVHLGPYSHRRFIERAVDTLMAWRPDVIVFGGDMVTRADAVPPEALKPFGRLHAPLGVWGVLGNHDHWSDPDHVQRLIERHTPIRILRNEARPVTWHGVEVWIVGVDDAWVGADDPERAFSDVPPDAPRLVIVHEPDAADWLPMTPATLQLSGHSHGGQVRLPLVGPLILPYLGRKYPMGLYRVRGGWLYTSRGLGVIFPPLRLNCRPEVTLVEWD